LGLLLHQQKEKEIVGFSFFNFFQKLRLNKEEVDVNDLKYIQLEMK
jgi:hypothetical protein